MNKEKRRTIYLHIGLPKTATTTLQKHYFSSHKEVCYLGKSFATYSAFDRWLYNLIFCLRDQHLIYFNSNKKRLISDLYSFVENTDNKKILVSNESVLSISLQPSSRSPFTPISVDFVSTLYKLQQLFLDDFVIKPIITIRRQDHLLLSYYAEHYYKFHRINNIRNFNKYVDYILGDGYYCFGGSLLDYGSLIKLVHDCFGVTNTGLLVYEEFSKQPTQFIKRLADFMDVRPDDWLLINEKSANSLVENKRSINSLTRKANKYNMDYYSFLKTYNDYKLGSRALNYLIYVFRSNLKSYRLKKEVSFKSTQDTVESIYRFYRTKNRYLDGEMGVGLGKYGYY